VARNEMQPGHKILQHTVPNLKASELPSSKSALRRVHRGRSDRRGERWKWERKEGMAWITNRRRKGVNI